MEAGRRWARTASVVRWYYRRRRPPGVADVGQSPQACGKRKGASCCEGQQASVDGRRAARASCVCGFGRAACGWVDICTAEVRGQTALLPRLHSASQHVTISLRVFPPPAQHRRGTLRPAEMSPRLSACLPSYPCQPETGGRTWLQRLQDARSSAAVKIAERRALSRANGAPRCAHRLQLDAGHQANASFFPP